MKEVLIPPNRHAARRNGDADFKILALIAHINSKFKVAAVCRDAFLVKKTGSLLHHILKLFVDGIHDSGLLKG